MAGRSHSCCTLTLMVLASVIIFAVLFRKELFVPHRPASKFPYTPKHWYWKKDSDCIDNNDKQSCHDATIQPFTNPFDNENDRLSNVKQYIKLWLNENKENRFNHQLFDSSISEYSKYNQDSIRSGIAYGINFNDFYQFIEYFNNNFETITNKVKGTITNNLKNQFVTNIAGINVHFARYTVGGQSSKSARIKDAILLLHGWPSSYHEFDKLVPILKDLLSKNNKKSIDIIVPSLPGYVFSDTSTDFSYFDVTGIACIFRELMESKYKLNYQSYIVVGSDWGSLIGHTMTYSTEMEEMDNHIRKLYDKNDLTNNNNKKLKGFLITSVAITSGPLYETILASLNIGPINEWIADYNEENVKLLSKSWNDPLNNVLSSTWDKSGYQHLQSTRPDTIGIALETNPIALLAYIYEKYISWSDTYSIESNRHSNNDNSKISGELTWDDVLITGMLYWQSGKITSSLRYYKESLFMGYTQLPKTIVPNDIYVGIGHYQSDPFSTTTFPPWVQYNYPSCIYFKHHYKGGHFAALEYPKEYAADIVNFLKNIEQQSDAANTKIKQEM